MFISYHQNQRMTATDLISNLERDYTIQTMINGENIELDQRNIQNSHLFICLVDNFFMSCEKCMAQLKCALTCKKDIFLFRNDDVDDVAPILGMYNKFKSNPIWIQLSDLNKVKGRFNARLR
jgi:hypothetical protein